MSQNQNGISKWFFKPKLKPIFFPIESGSSPRDHYKASDDPVARYTILLNYCTGDVERFCAELQRIKEIGDRAVRIPALDSVFGSSRKQISYTYTACGQRMAHRKWKETKLQPGTAGPGNMLGCSLVSFHFLWAIHPIRPVV